MSPKSLSMFSPRILPKDLALSIHFFVPPPDYKVGFGGKFGVQTDRQDKSAAGWDHIEKVEKHESQVDHKKGFGGKYGVGVQDKSAVGWEHHEKVDKHESQKGSVFSSIPSLSRLVLPSCQITSPVSEESSGWRSRRTKVPSVGNITRRWKNMSLRKVSFAYDQLQSVSIYFQSVSTYFPICFASSCACCYFLRILKTTRRDSGANSGFRRTGWTQVLPDGIMWRRFQSTPANRVGSKYMWKLDEAALTGFLCIAYCMTFKSFISSHFLLLWS